MSLVCRFVTQKVSVCPCLFEKSIAFRGKLTKGKCYGTIDIFFLYAPHNVSYNFVCIKLILSSLQNKSSETEIIPDVAAFKYFFF